MKFGLFVTGYKGMRLLESLEHFPEFVVSYDNKERNDSVHYQKIVQWCMDNQIKLYQKSNFEEEQLKKVEKVFVVGWQFLIKNSLNKYIVLHDSYLPERRGFCPTVSSLLDGEDYIGASCFQPTDTEEDSDPDYGIVYGREKTTIKHPITIRQAFDLVVEMYIKLIDIFLKGTPSQLDIDYKNDSSFVVWKDKEDLRIDWSNTADNIHKKICATGYPYEGSTSLYDNRLIYIDNSKVFPQINILNPKENCGKIWKLDDGNPVVICGDGLLQILSAHTENGEIINFKLLRKRFL